MPAYRIDPQTGLPIIQTLGGGGLPLPLSPQDMAAAGAQEVPDWAGQVPVLPEELRGPGPGAVAGVGMGGMDEPPPDWFFEQQRQQQERAQLLGAIGASGGGQPVPDGPSHGGVDRRSTVQRLADRPMPTEAPATGGAIDPSELAMPGGGQSAPQQGGAGGMDPLVEQVFRESLAGGRGGGGGKPGLRVTGQTVKYTLPGEVPEDVSAEAERARVEREGFDTGMALLTDERRDQVYQARQAEMLYRQQQIQEEQARRAEQQRRLDEYAVKRDALLEEASSLKAPDMADYWGSKSDLAKMMTAVSIAVGGALQGLRGGSNPGLEMSNQAIDRWVATKRDEYERAKDRVNAADNKYARMVQTFESENLAAANLREQAYAVRDAMLNDFAQQMGTPKAMEAAQALQLQDKERRAQGVAQAYASASREIEEKLSMQGGGGGGGRATLLKALQNAAAGQEALNKIQGKGGDAPMREVQNEKVDAVTGALDALTAADKVQSHLKKLGYEDRDADDPTTGLLDRAANAIPGSDTRRLVQDLEQDTFGLARGAQLSLGKSDNDARLAEQWASGGGGSGRERVRAAQNIAKKSLGKIQDTLSSLTPAQRQAFINSLPPERQQQLKEALGGVARPSLAPSERPVQ